MEGLIIKRKGDDLSMTQYKNSANFRTHPVKVIRGATENLTVSIRGRCGEPYALSESDILRFGVKKHPDDSQYVIVKEIISDGGGQTKFTFVINPEDTGELACGKYYYDIGLQTIDGYYNVIECSPFDIAYNITGRTV